MSSTPEMLRQVVSATGEKLWVANYIWDPNVLDWVAQTAATAGGGGAVTIADGQDTTQGAKADTAWDGAAASTSVVAILKRVAALLAGGGGGGPATIADGADATEGAKADAAWSGVGAGSVVAILKAIWAAITGVLTIGGTVAVSSLPAGLATGAKQDTGNASLASLDTKAPLLGQALAAASVPVVLPAAQVTTLTPPAAITGFALEAGHLATLDAHLIKADTDHVTVTSSALPTGAALEGGNLATIAGKDFATQATLASAKTDLDTIVAQTAGLATAGNQSTELSTLAAIAAALGGTPSAAGPAPFGSVPDVLAKLGKKLDAHTTALTAIAAAQPKPVPQRSTYATLLHR